MNTRTRWLFAFAMAVVGLCVSQGLTQCDEDDGPNGPISCVVTWDPDGIGPLRPLLVIGGAFTEIDGVPANNIAAWDGYSWSALGDGLGGGTASVDALEVFNGHLIASGGFTSAGGAPASRIARWDGNAWYTLGSGLNQSAVELCVYQGELVACGGFTMAGGVAAPHVAKWNGTTWSAVSNFGATPALAVWGIEEHSGQLFCVGLGSDFRGFAALWTGTVWNRIGASPPNTGQGPVGLRSDGSALIAVGNFQQFAGISADNVASYDGTSWSQVGGGIPQGPVYGALRYAGTLIAHTAPEVPLGLYRLNGNVWLGLAQTGDGQITQVCEHDGQLVVVGSFTSINGIPIRGIAVCRSPDFVWSPLTSRCRGWLPGERGSYIDGEVWAAASWDPDGNGPLAARLVVGGYLGIHDSGSIESGVFQWAGTRWEPLGENFPNANPIVTALAVHQNRLIAAGYFSSIGGVAANSIAAWDGVSWSPLGAGLQGAPWALAVYNGDLYVGGYITSAGGVAVNEIARWNGSTWQACGVGTDDAVYTMCVHDGKLVVGGAFTSAGGTPRSRIATWDGAAWGSVGTGLNSFVYSLASQGATLYAGGSFNMAGGVSVDRVASWNGSSWAAVGAGVDLEPTDLAVYQGLLYAIGGARIYDGFIPVDQPIIRRWTGTAWEDVAGGLPQAALWLPGSDQTSNSLVEHAGELYVCGGFTMAGQTPVTNVAKWDGSQWRDILPEPGTNNTVYAAAEFDGDLIIGGTFTSVAGVPIARLARWDDGGLDSIGVPNSSVYSITQYQDRLIIGGQFTSISGGVSAARVAAWDGTTWSPLGLGVTSGGGQVLSMVSHGADLIVGGAFSAAGGLPASRIARWDGAAWHEMGSGMNNTVRAVCVYRGEVIAGGTFTTAGGATANRVARWDGSAWQPMGTGFDQQSVYALTVAGGTLYAAGNFASAGGVATLGVARWDGAAWQPCGSGMNFLVRSLGTYNGELVAGGFFTTAGGVPANRVARWDGSQWHALSSGMNDEVVSFTQIGGSLIATGWFTTAGGTTVNRVARWGGDSWQPIGTGLNGPVAKFVSIDGDLFAAGSFSLAGGAAARNIARWDGFSWYPLGAGLTGQVPAHAIIDHEGDLVVGGATTNHPVAPVMQLRRWDGQAWVDMVPPGSPGRVTALRSHAGDLVVGGEFASIGGVAATNIARWDGAAWSALGSGLDDRVVALSSLQGNLVATGWFEASGATPLNHVGRWNGSSWQAMGGAQILADPFSSIDTMLEFDGGLYAAGDFDFAGSGGTVENFARWDGAAWDSAGLHALGFGHALAVYNGALVISGGNYQFGEAMGFSPFPPATARLKDGCWLPLDVSWVRSLSLAQHGTELVAGPVSMFETAFNPGNAGSRWMRWTDTGVPEITTHPESQDVDEGAAPAFVLSHARGYRDLTYTWKRDGQPVGNGPGGASIGGGTVIGASTRRLAIVGAKPSDAGSYVCTVSSPCGSLESQAALLTVVAENPADFDGNGSIEVADIFNFLAAWFAGDTAAQNFGGQSGVAAIFAFLTVWFAG